MNVIAKNKDGAPEALNNEYNNSSNNDNDGSLSSSGSYERSEGLDSEEEENSSTNSISSDDSFSSGSSSYDDSSSERLSDEDGSSQHDAPSQHSSTSSQHITTEQQHQQQQQNISSTTIYPINTLIHRRGKSNANGQLLPQCKPNERDSPDEPSRSKYRRDKHSNKRSNSRSKSSSDNNSKNLLLKYICCQTSKKSTHILLLAFTLWIFAQLYYFYHWNTTNNNGGRIGRRGGRNRGNNIGLSRGVQHHQLSNPKSLEEMEILREQRMIEAQRVLGSAAGGGERDSGGKPNNKLVNRSRGEGGRKKKSGSKDPEGNTRTERLREGCSTLQWHSYNFPNCNEIHEIDLRHVIERGRSRKHHTQEKEEDEEGDNDDIESTEETITKKREHNYYPWGFVGNGLWRDVFTCDPREETLIGTTASSTPPQPPAVLKIMKSEHKYDVRNINRHRRDALVMERLSSSHHLVPIYGYCAQTVLTQAISHTLDDVIYAREHERVKKWSPHGGYKTKPPLESWMGTDEDGELLLTRETEIGRIKLALGVFRGLVDLHEGVDDSTSSTNDEWLPIVHADLQSKQYLVDAQTGHVYLNDFNRCRFMTKKDEPANNDGSSIESCPLYIPSAPGSSRSPEEYSMGPLSEKLDIYSAGNVLYGIITGERPWNNERGKHIKEDIQDGKRPQVDESIRNAKGTVDAVLTRLLDRVYEHDPEERASAREIVDELEDLLEVELMKRKKKDRVS